MKIAICDDEIAQREQLKQSVSAFFISKSCIYENWIKLDL